MSLYPWKKMNVQHILTCRFYSPTYSPSGKYMMDYKSIGALHTIVIMNIETNLMRTYATITGQYICCYYWLNDDEIVVITQGGPRENQGEEIVIYRLCKMNHDIGETVVEITWEYPLPCNSKVQTNCPLPCATPLILKGHVFCLFQVGSEFVLLPWDVRRCNPSYPPIRINIQIENIDKMHLMKPRTHLMRGYPDVDWCRFYGYGSSIYLELQITLEDTEIIYMYPYLTDRFFQLNLSRIDLTSGHIIIINHNSPEWSIVQMAKQKDDDTEYFMSSTQENQQGEYIVKTAHSPNHEGKTVDIFLINLKEKTVGKETVEYFYDEDTIAQFTVYNNKYLAWRNDGKYKTGLSYEFQLQPSTILSMQSLQQMCWEKIFFTLDKEKNKKKRSIMSWIKKSLRIK